MFICTQAILIKKGEDIFTVEIILIWVDKKTLYNPKIKKYKTGLRY